MQSRLDAVRRLSNSNAQIRGEMKEVMWRNITIECSNIPAFEFGLSDLLTDRPLIHVSIKHLRLDLNYIIETEMLRPHKLQTLKQGFIRKISKLLDLDTLHLDLRLSSEALPFQLEDPRFNFLKGFRSLKVAKAFTMTLELERPILNDNRPATYNQTRLAAWELFKTILLPGMETALYDKFRPVSLRPPPRKEPVTTEEIYLDQRLLQTTGDGKLEGPDDILSSIQGLFENTL
jgi:hypothetical protein